ncbi:MAG: 16S rRNA (cytosine(1402)-N(4))-methyltransferase RsmH [Deltaproteobacteria bacterium]|nr:16S rRNA (cytosine(1402)-N(4))-methyltransferase RsmH [Deltaproteobacteria bacterium]
MPIEHIPVLLNEALDILNIKQGNVYVDGTLGGGGFSEDILRRLHKDGFLIGIDRDAEAVKNAQSKFEKKFDNKNFKLVHSNFSKIDEIIKSEGFTGIDGVVLDLGISSIQLEGGRGFSFNEDGNGGGLDMRMDKESDLTAYDVINDYPEKTLADIIWEFGDEKFSRKIAKRIIEYRKNKPVETSLELADIVRKAVYRGYGKFKKFKTDPATKTFMALRIFVNKEYDSLSEFLEKLKNVLNKGGMAVIISFHSGEDRIVKHFLKNNLDFKPVNRKPIVPGDEEMKINPRSRSAKLRAFYHV